MRILDTGELEDLLVLLTAEDVAARARLTSHAAVGELVGIRLLGLDAAHIFTGVLH